MAIKLQLDDHLIKSRIIDIKRIKNEIVISAILDNKEKNFAIKFKEGQTEQETSDLLERKLNSPDAFATLFDYMIIILILHKVTVY